MSRTAKTTRTQIDALQHRDTRVNIPTEELREFVADDEREPKTLLYPRDPSLDPQLVWKGKDEQDRDDLAVQSVPIYIQEKIQPRALIEDLRREAGAGIRDSEQLSLFGDFDGIEFEDLVDFYQHEQNWSNRMILGDSLLVMASLAEKEGLKGKVQTIYLDPPYGIKFGSNWQVSTRKRDVKDGRAEDMSRQPEQIKAFRDTWQLGIHSYLAYLRDRLVVARELLTESGSVFVQIGDENVHLVRCLLDEVFGSENFVSLITVKKTSASTEDLLPSVNDYLVWYGKNRSLIKYRQLVTIRELGDDGTDEYRYIRELDGTTRSATSQEAAGITTLAQGAEAYRPDNLTSSHHYSLGLEPFDFRGKEFRPGNRYWSTSPIGLKRLSWSDRLIGRSRDLAYRRLLSDYPVMPVSNTWMDTIFSSRVEDKSYVVQTSIKVLQRCLLMTTDPGDLVLDPTCGSGTTAYVAEQWGRRWITIDTSRVALALARTRLMAGRFPYYLLADSDEGRAKEREVSGVAAETTTAAGGDIRKGFVYRRVPHITLKSIANNPEIDEIHARYAERLDPLRAEINRLVGTAWEEWEVPRELPAADSSAAAGDGERSFAAAQDDRARGAVLLQQWWELRRERQREIDASIARRAETETLYDQPYEDGKRVRVSGPFTVESLSPHRVLAIDPSPDGSGQAHALPTSEIEGRKDAESNGGGFVAMILENLKKAGVQNTVRQERLTFDRLEPYGGEWLQAAGEYTDSSGLTRRVAVAIGPEHGTVGPATIKEAAKAAMHGVGFDLLVVCGFAFDAHAGETAREISPSSNGKHDGFVAEETRQYGKLPVLLARMNPDLTMGDALKTTGAGNLFMVFGEPDIEVRRDPDGRLVVEVRGVDVYVPATGEIRSSSTDEIACWFIDTNYNAESFFVRHAYFTGADEPYDKLKRALRAEIDEAAWSQLYSTASRPFDPPATGRIAVKVINHYGDEVLKVYDV